MPCDFAAERCGNVIMSGIEAYLLFLKRLFMPHNIGTIDRIVRSIAGSILILLAILNVIGWWGWLGIMPIMSAILRYTPVYGLLGITTDKRSKQP